MRTGSKSVLFEQDCVVRAFFATFWRARHALHRHQYPIYFLMLFVDSTFSWDVGNPDIS